MTAPGADVMVTFFPPKVIGLKVEELVKAKVVRPTNVTTELAFRLARLTLLLVGTAISWSVIAVQEATAGAIWEYSVAVHVVPVEVAVELEEVVEMLVDVDVELEELVLEIDVEVEVVELVEMVVDVDAELEEEEAVETTAVKRHEHAVDTFEGRFEHCVA
jgi:hypothetical protein